ncbi:Protein CBG27031 [Caenorhabditis briggsae]|nr:Protein CBG27031 [Caenorhabditis briggsae]CAS01025.1 Protein CBG27031 [Caenorhabditis briggsae]
MVTLGIGHDVSAEMQLKEMYTRIKFYGADPSSYINRNVYEKDLGGKFFHYDSSNNDAAVFLAYKIRQKKIDFLWVDLKGHEYRILNRLHSDGPLDRKRVKVCQINVDMYMNKLEEIKKFYDFVWKILEDKRCIVMKPIFVNDRFIRAFLVNVADRECADLFLS